MVQQSPIDEQIREFLLQQEGIDEARRQQAPINQVRQERRKWEIRLGYFILAGVAVVVFALNRIFITNPISGSDSSRKWGSRNPRCTYLR